jgi:adenosylmethionine-8-amino-7-oxononanoate aminotransferase
MTTDAVYRAFYDDSVARAVLHSHTHAGNALACRAALATLDIFEQDAVIHTNRVKASHLNQAARAIASHPKVKNFRNCGMIWAFDVETSDPAFAQNFFQAALKQELSLRPLGNTIYFMPPYIIDQPEMDLLVAGTLRALESC